MKRAKRLSKWHVVGLLLVVFALVIIFLPDKNRQWITRRGNSYCVKHICVTSSPPFTEKSYPQCIDYCEDDGGEALNLNGPDGTRGTILVGYDPGPKSTGESHTSEPPYCQPEKNVSYKITAIQVVPKLKGVKLVTYISRYDLDRPIKKSPPPYNYYQRIMDDKTVQDCELEIGKTTSRHMAYVFDFRNDNYRADYTALTGFKSLEEAEAHASSDEGVAATKVLSSIYQK